MSNSLRIVDPTDKTQDRKYPSTQFPQLPVNINNRGKELFEYLYNEVPQPTNPTTLLPPTFRIVQVGTDMEAVPVVEIKTGQNVATDGYLSFREKFKREFSGTGVVIYQRGYGITNAQSRRPIIATTSISPCIAVLAYRSDTQTAALAHVDAEQDFSSLEDMLDLPDFQGVANVQLHFYGGLSNFDESRNTCYGLLNAVINANQRRPNFIICSFDVMALPHKSMFSFDARTGKRYALCPPIEGIRGFLLDSQFRLWPNGNYLAVKDAVAMKNEVEALPNGTPLKAQLKRLRLQWDGTAGLVTFAKNVNRIICELIVQKASLPHVDGAVNDTFTKQVTSVLIAKDVPIAFEQSLKEWLMYIENPTLNPHSPEGQKAAASIVAAVQAVMQANLTLPQRVQAFETTLNNWVVAHPHPYERKY